MTKGYFGSKLSKKSGNYVGKVRASVDRSTVMIYGKTEGANKVEYGHVEFDKVKTSFFSRNKVPRKLSGERHFKPCVCVRVFFLLTRPYNVFHDTSIPPCIR